MTGESKKHIDLLFSRIVTIEKFLHDINFRPYTIEDLKIDNGERDALFEDAVRVVCQHDRASASLLQRALSLGYARAAQLLAQLEKDGVIGLDVGSKPREVLIKDANAFLRKKSFIALRSL